MKKLFKGFVMSASMFSIIPLPSSFWNDGSMPYVITFMPLVGFIIGSLWYAAAYFLSAARGAFLTAAIITLFPFFLSGFIHTDGFLDTADAVFSRRDMQEKIRILKDPHTGAFAVISLCVLMLISFCAVYDITASNKPYHLFIFLPAVTRSVSGITLLLFKPLSETGFGASFKKGAGKAHMFVLFFYILICIILSFILFNNNVSIPLCAAVAAGFLTAVYLCREFGGVSGDICGAVITVGELTGLICLALI